MNGSEGHYANETSQAEKGNTARSQLYVESKTTTVTIYLGTKNKLVVVQGTVWREWVNEVKSENFQL